MFIQYSWPCIYEFACKLWEFFSGLVESGVLRPRIL